MEAFIIISALFITVRDFLAPALYLEKASIVAILAFSKMPWIFVISVDKSAIMGLLLNYQKIIVIVD